MTAPSPGVLDAQAFLDGERLLLLSGQLRAPFPAPAADGTLVTSMGRVAVRLHGTSVPDGTGHRCFLLLRLPPMPAISLRSVEVAGLGDVPMAAEPRPLPVPELRRGFAAAPAKHRAALLALLPRAAFGGADTLPALRRAAVHAGFDRLIRLDAASCLLMGSVADPGRRVAALRLCTPGQSAELVAEDWLPVPRPDLLAEHHLPGGGEALTGFVARLPVALPPGVPCWGEAELLGGEVGQKPLHPEEPAGLATIRELLALPRPPARRFARAMDRTLGPAVEAMNAARLAAPRGVEELAFGTPPARPARSAVVPLHGRLDFMELQLALFSARPDPGAELLYVLDEPARMEEAERLATSAHARFGLPFRLLLLERNLGFAPACNEGAKRARGRFVCLLNSDVFPLQGQGMGFLSALCAVLETDRKLGAVGPLLLYEDGTVQHQGMGFETVRGLPPWPFPQHLRKALPPPEGDAVLPAEAITGACMVLRRAEWDALGGFDEGYVIGDFEDADLCQRLAARGLSVAVASGVRLFHLERQSQGEEAPWRMGTTLFNAWRHARLWAEEPEA